MTYKSPTQPLCFFCAKPIPAAIRHCHSWDGQSYRDEFFCSEVCCKRYAYEMARAWKKRSNVA